MTMARRTGRWLRGVAALLAAGWASAGAGQVPPTVLAGSAIPKWMEELPRINLQGGEAADTPPWTIDTHYGYDPTTMTPAKLSLHMCEVRVQMLPRKLYGPTTTWAYRAGGCPTSGETLDTYLGPVVVAQRGISTEITYVNELGTVATTKLDAYRTSTDQTLHWADPLSLGCMMKAAMEEWKDANGVFVMYPPPTDPCAWNYGGAIPAVAHLHGGEVPAEVDGSPDSWFTPDLGEDSQFGPKYYTKGYEERADAAPGKAVYTYPNVQEAAPLWFHDHTLGATRLNVYAGLAGAYPLKDDPAKLADFLPAVEETIPIVIQDRRFYTSGELWFTAGLNGGFTAPSPGWALNPEHPYWNPEFLGDAIAVNGKVWPRLTIPAKRHRFIFLNGSNARTYELFLTNPKTKVNGPALWVIGTDGGYLDAPAKIDPSASKTIPQKLVIMPGERYEVIVDFTSYAGKTLLLRNTARAPYPGGATPNGATTGQILQLQIGPAEQGTPYDPAAPGAIVRKQPMQRLVQPGAVTPSVAPDLVRQLTLNEVMGMPMTAVNPINGALTAYPGGPLEILVNNTKWTGVAAMGEPRTDFTPRDGDDLAYSEVPVEGDVEVWEIVNTTADAHPIHLHLVQFQILSRQRFDAAKYAAAYALAFPAGCTPVDPMGTTYCPGYGPPLAYGTKDSPQATSGTIPTALRRDYPVRTGVPVVGGNPDVTPYLQGPVLPAVTYERGWKDTVQAPPGMVTRILVRWGPTDTATTAAARFAFDPAGGGTYNYVWHCHIIDHEDNEMMRPDFVTPASGVTREFTRGTEVTSY